VGLVEDREVIWGDAGFAEPGKHPVAGKSVDAYDGQIALGADEWV
jgi:hypothetical protein